MAKVGNVGEVLGMGGYFLWCYSKNYRCIEKLRHKCIQNDKTS